MLKWKKKSLFGIGLLTCKVKAVEKRNKSFPTFIWIGADMKNVLWETFPLTIATNQDICFIFQTFILEMLKAVTSLLAEDN